MKENEYYKGLLIGLNNSIAGQLDRNSNADREFLEKLYKLINEEVKK